jgi:hypothetical protein
MVVAGVTVCTVVVRGPACMVNRPMSDVRFDSCQGHRCIPVDMAKNAGHRHRAPEGQQQRDEQQQADAEFHGCGD